MYMFVCMFFSSYAIILCIDLMGLLEKRRFKNFVGWANEYDAENPTTHKGMDAFVVVITYCRCKDACLLAAATIAE